MFHLVLVVRSAMLWMAVELHTEGAACRVCGDFVLVAEC